VTAPHPDSVAPRPAGGSVTLKVHRAIWSGALPANSLAAIAECCAAGVARAEIDIQPRRDGGFVVFHDDRLDRSTDARGAVRDLGAAELAQARLRWGGETTAHGLCDLGDALAAIAAAPYPTVFELDLKELEPWPWPRVEAFVRLLEPVRDRVLLGTEADWNLRRILTVDPAIPVSLNPGAYLDWTAGEGHAAKGTRRCHAAPTGTSTAIRSPRGGAGRSVTTSPTDSARRRARQTSSSTRSAPRRSASAKEAMVFSGARAAAPRCPRTRTGSPARRR